MAFLKVKRRFEFIGSLLNYNIYLNNVLVAELGNGKEIKLELEDSLEIAEVYVKVNKIKSNTLRLECNKKEFTNLKIFSSIYLNLFYVLTFLGLFILQFFFDFEAYVFILFPIPLLVVFFYFYLFDNKKLLKIKEI